MLPSAAFAPQLPQQSLRVAKTIVKNPPSDFQQRTYERITQRVSHGCAFLLRRDDALVTEDGQLLRDEWLVKRKLPLELLHGSLPSHQRFQYSDARRVCQCVEKLRLEALELAHGRFAAPFGTHLRH